MTTTSIRERERVVEQQLPSEHHKYPHKLYSYQRQIKFYLITGLIKAAKLVYPDQYQLSHRVVVTLLIAEQKKTIGVY